MIYDPKNMTKGEALHLLKSIDRKLKNVTSDSEISGRLPGGVYQKSLGETGLEGNHPPHHQHG